MPHLTAPFSELRPHWLVTGCKDGVVRVFDLGDPAITNAIAPAPPPQAPESTSFFFGSSSSSSSPASAMPTAPAFELRGHAERVFHTQWSPLVRNMLCSGSDDRSIGVWQLPARAAAAAHHVAHGSGDGSSGSSGTNNTGPVSAALRGFLRGHTSNVRALVWHTELPHVLLSGSWDGTIRYDFVVFAFFENRSCRN